MRVEWILRRQHGVIGRGQALAAGLSARQIERRLASGGWRSIYPRVYAATDREFTSEARIFAGALGVGEPVTLSGIAAAWWHGLWPDLPAVVDLTVPVHRCLRARPGVRVRRRDLDENDRLVVRGLWVTSVALSVLEAAVALGDRGSELLDRALQRRVRLEVLYRTHGRNLGRRGSAAASRLLVAATDRAASAAERKLIAVLRAAAMSGWVLHFRVGGYELDLAFPKHLVAVEVDGWAWHSDAGTFQRDRQRQNTLVLAGWTVLRFTWHDLTHRPAQVVAEIRAALGDHDPARTVPTRR